jgi:hypothetical protein
MLETRDAYVRTEQRPNDDFDEEAIPSNVSAVRRRANVNSKEEYCVWV